MILRLPRSSSVYPKWVREHEEYWDDISEIYDELYRDKWSCIENEYYVSIILHFLRGSSPNILDLGCGTGLVYSLLFEKQFQFNYTGIDISRGMLRTARSKYPYARWIKLSLDELEVCDIGRFDLIVGLNGVLSYSRSPSRLIRCVTAKLYPSGALILSGFSSSSLYRIIRGDRKVRGRLASRNSRTLNPPPVTFLKASTIESHMTECRYEDIEIHGVSCLGGLVQRPCMWLLDRAMCSAFPSIGYSFLVAGRFNG